MPTVADLEEADPSAYPIIKPAPVRLAPEPRGDLQHAQALAGSATARPFGQTETPGSAPVAYAPALPPKRSHLAPLLIGLGVLLVIGGGVGVGLGLVRSRSNTKPSPTPTSALTRSREEKPLLAGLERVQTDCYSLQLPSGPTVQVNKDCAFSAAFGDQKLASITISALRDFNVVATEDGSTESASGKRFDSKKVLESLITSTTAGNTVASRTDISVGGLSAVQIASSTQGGSSPVVAYVFIVLPQTDQQFAEKSFVAFTITGAYNDDYSRKSFDQALTTWTWK